MRKSIILLPVLLLSGCAYYQPIGISSTSIGSQYERPTGMAEGVSRRWLFFPCYNACPIGEDSLKAAIDDALEGNMGDTLANVFAERRIIVFPHIYFPLLVRSDIVVTGTLVKYNTKEFPPDNEPYLYSSSAVEVWNGLLNLSQEEQRKRIPTLPQETILKLRGYADQLSLSIKQGSKEEGLYEVITGAKPYRPIAKSTSESAASCNSYYCMLSLDMDNQRAKISALQKSQEDGDRIILGNILKAANNRIRSCVNGNVYVDLETRLNPGEKEFLTHLCTIGELK